LNFDDAPAEIYLKLECLQPTGSFKVRGAGNALALIPPEQRARGVYTCSAGNMAQALAWHARREGIPCTVIIPDTAPATKLSAIQRYGAKTILLSWDEVWKVAVEHRYPPLDGSVFVHPFADSGMIAGNGTAGLEIIEDLPDVDSIVVPFGGGGLSTGIASAAKALKSSVKVYGSEAATATPLFASLEAGMVKDVERTKSFVDGIGSKNILAEMWPFIKNVIDGSIVVPLADVVSALKLLVERNRIVAEGAGATSVAAALTGKAGNGRVVSVVSGGNIDPTKLIKILQGEVP
jgi:threonine dehydratase